MSYESMEFRKFTFKSEFDKALNTLDGILQGILLDGNVNQDEINELNNWCLLNKKFINKYPFKELIPLIESSLNDKFLIDEEIEDITWAINAFKTKPEFYGMITADIQKLQGILHGILADNTINDEEIIGLKQWLNENEHLTNTYPYDEVCSLIMSVLADGKIDDNERDILKVFFGEFVDTTMSYNINKNEIDNLKKTININGICSMCPEINIQNNMFCFTGTSSRAMRSEIQETIESLNGVYNNNVVKTTKYLIVGNEGNPCWAFSCYGRKVEKAMELRKSGKEILIVHENDFWDAVENNKKCS